MGSRANAAFGLAFLLLLAALPGRVEEPPAAAAPAPRDGAARLLWGLPLDLNREDERALQVLPGIGPMRARAIVAARPLCSAADLARIRGIGPATRRALRGKVAASGPKAACGD